MSILLNNLLIKINLVFSTIDKGLGFYPHLVDFTINILTVIGTLGAVFAAIWLAYNQHRPRLKASVSLYDIISNGVDDSIKNLFNLDSHKTYVALNIRNTGTATAFINGFSFSCNMYGIKTGLLMLPLIPNLITSGQNELEITVNKNQLIIFNEEQEFLKNFKDFINKKDINIFQKLFRNIIFYFGLFHIDIYTLDGTKHKIEIEKKFFKQIKSLSFK
ncbi:MAG TPA: hypothetical protein DDW90_02935 [Cyanobacteria bacterium UBA9971]|nr:hypothetical protein [Cyanobacteria bacterium UBA9971]